jgi:hypothetical protein
MKKKKVTIVTTRHAASRCSVCGKTLDASTSVVDGRSPKRGDIGMCFECGTVLIFTDDDLHLRIASEAEIQSLSVETLKRLQEYADWHRRARAQKGEKQT